MQIPAGGGANALARSACVSVSAVSAEGKFRVINQVAWAVPPGGKTNTRPVLLARELVKLGVINESYETLFHGRQTSASGHVNAGRWWPGGRFRGAGSTRAVLSPVFYSLIEPSSKWIDFYDDWSLAPDINVWHRTLSALSYRAVARGGVTVSGVTCNSPYMAAKLGLPSSAIVPNGVDPDVAALETADDPTRRLILLGHFFAGRTDFGLIERICTREYFDQVVIGAPGSDPTMLALLDRLRHRLGSALQVYDWLSVDDLAALAGRQTAAIVPHVVSDYTLSQDLMKVYTLSALGMRVICPRLLWPHALPKDFAYLLDYGVKLEDTLAEWLDDPGPSLEWRQRIGNEHSWQTRAVQVAGLIGEVHC